MTDFSKRNTLKTIAGSAAAVAVAPMASASSLLNSTSDPAHQALNNSRANVQISSRISAESHELELLISNPGDSAATITEIYPSRVFDAKGTFELEAIAGNGKTKLEAGESITVPMTHSTAYRHTALAHSAASMNDVIRNNVSIGAIATSGVGFA